MTVQEDQVEFANGHTGIYGIVVKSDFALIIPFDGTHFHLVSQFRYPLQKISLEFPQGKHEDDPTADPLQMACDELREETGLVTKNIKEIGYLYEASGYSTQAFHIFYATDFQRGEKKLDTTEVGLETLLLTEAELENMILDGTLTDAPTVSAFGLWKLKRDRNLL
jgi:8-oxo-dGTP pyrophosphatase MutT (NUDIX family)